MVVAATAVAAFTAADRPMAALVVAGTPVAAGTEASAGHPRPVVPDRDGLGLGKARALVTPRPDGIRSPGRKMEDQGTAGASRLLTAPVWRQLMAQARVQRTALASPMGNFTPSETRARAHGSQPVTRSTAAAWVNSAPVFAAGTGAAAASDGAAAGDAALDLAGDSAGDLAGASAGALSGIGHRTITAHGGLTIPITSTSTRPDVINGFGGRFWEGHDFSRAIGPRRHWALAPGVVALEPEQPLMKPALDGTGPH